MKRFLHTLLLILFSCSATQAQHRMPHERIHAAKIAYITDRLQLNYRQSADFVPLYNDYEKEIRDARFYFFKKYMRGEPEDTDENTSLRFVDDNLDYQERVIAIKRKYNDLFLRIISPKQLSELNKAEREFKQLLIKRLDPRSRGSRFGHRNNYYRD